MFKRIRKSIKYKLIIAQLITSLVLLLVITTAYTVFEVSDFKQSLRNELNATADVLIYNIVPAINFMDSTEAVNALLALQSDEQLLNAWIIDASGKLFASFSKEGHEIFAFSVYNPEMFDVGKRIYE
ncbi:MAG: hypothetical protein EOM76_10175, partial [Sphingobacteriia bacterium]|nr:hypothetical protein [Sphingobacteriia bacterium]